MSAAPGSSSKPRRRTKKDKSKQALLQHVAAVTAGPSSSPVVQHAAAGPSQPGPGPRDWLQDAAFEDIMEDLSSRFILNLPEEELSSPERICFQLEQAHWFYEDFIREQHPHLPTFTLRTFSQIFFTLTDLPDLLPTTSGQGQAGEEAWDWEDFQSGRAYERFMRYKARVPVCGAIILSEGWDKCLLVKGWKSTASWGFPKGKINDEEDKWSCAIREVFEETGFDCSPYSSPDDQPLTYILQDQQVTLYVCPGVPESTVFQTQTRKEISAIEWFKLTDLPTWRKKGGGKKGPKFYGVTPFVQRLKEWLAKNHPTSAGPSSANTSIATAQPAGDSGEDGSSLADLLAKLQMSAQAAQQADAVAREPAQQPEIPDFFRQLMAGSSSSNIAAGTAMPPIPAPSAPSNPLEALLAGVAPPAAPMPVLRTPPPVPQSAYPSAHQLTPPRAYSPPAHIAKSPLGPARPPRHGRKDSDAEIVEKVGRVMERERKQKALLDGMFSNLAGMDAPPPPPVFPPPQPQYRPVPMPPPPSQQQIVLPNGTLLSTPPRHYLPQMGRPPYPQFHAPSPTYPSGYVPMLLAHQASLASPTLQHGQPFPHGRPPMAMPYPPAQMHPGVGQMHAGPGPAFAFPPPSGPATSPRAAPPFGAPNTANLSHSANDLLSLLKG